MSHSSPEAIKRAQRAVLAATEPLAAIGAARRVRELAEAQEAELIAQARRSGVSWSRIGAFYGLTKQGAQQRFRGSVKSVKGPHHHGDSSGN